MAKQALDTFVAEIDGNPVCIQKGQVLPDGHAAVKLDGGRGLLFAAFDSGDEPPKKTAKAAAGEAA